MRDLILALILAGIAVVVYAAAAAIPPSLLDDRFGAGLLPKILAVSLGVLAAALAISAILRSRPSASSTSRDDGIGRGYLPVSAVTGLLILYIGVLDAGLVPFLPASIIFVFAVSMILGHRSPRAGVIAALLAVVISFGVEIVFTRVFLVFLP